MSTKDSIRQQLLEQLDVQRKRYAELKKENDFLKREILLIHEKDEEHYQKTIKAVNLNDFRSNHE